MESNFINLKHIKEYLSGMRYNDQNISSNVNIFILHRSKTIVLFIYQNQHLVIHSKQSKYDENRNS